MASRMIRHETGAHQYEPMASTLNLSFKGIAVGGMVGAVGGGGLSVPLLLRYMPVHKAIGTAAAMTVPVALVGTIAYGFATPPAECGGDCIGYIYLPAVCSTGVAAVLFAPIGSTLAHSLPVPALKRVFAAVLTIVALNIGRKILPNENAIAQGVRVAVVALQPDLGLCRARTDLRPKLLAKTLEQQFAGR